MTLREWMNHEGLTQVRAAEKIGVTQPHVSQWLRGSIPDPKNILRIEEVSGGKVTLRDWLKPATTTRVG